MRCRSTSCAASAAWRNGRRRCSSAAGGATFVALTVVVSTFGCNAAAILAGARLLFAMARDGVFLPAAARVHPVYRTPHIAVVALSSWSALLALSGTYEQLFTYVMFASSLLHMIGAFGVFRLRRQRPDRPRPVPRVGLSGRAGRLHPGVGRLRAQHADRAAEGVARRARLPRAGRFRSYWYRNGGVTAEAMT